MNAHSNITSAAELEAGAEPQVIYDTDMLLLGGLSGFTEGTLAAARDLATLIDEAERLGDAATAVEEDEDAGDEQEAQAEEVWEEARDRAAAAALALLDDAAPGADATARLTIYLRERWMSATPRKRWRPVSAQEIIEQFNDEAMPSPENDLAPALAFAMKHMTGPSADKGWTAALVYYDATKAKLAEVQARVDAAAERASAEAPWPAELADPEGGYYASEDEIGRLPKVPFATKMKMVELLREFAPRQKDAHARHRVAELEDELEAAHGAYGKALGALLATTPPDAPALAKQLREHLIFCLYGPDDCDFDPDNPEHVSFALSTDSFPERRWVQIYLGALRLAGIDTPALAASAFDPEAWLSDFESLPGHRLSSTHGPIYDYPEAWPADRASDEEVTIYDRARLAQFFDGNIPSDMESLQLGSTERVKRFYADDPAECDRLCRAIESRQAGPVGRSRWEALKPWQQEMVKEAALERARTHRSVLSGAGHKWVLPPADEAYALGLRAAAASIAAE